MNEPTERGMEALALEMCRMERRPDAPAACGIHREQARAVLYSDWYAERIAQARREGAAEALREFAGGLTGMADYCATVPDDKFAPGVRLAARKATDRAALRGDA